MSAYFGGNWLGFGGISMMIGALLGIVIYSWLLRRAARERRRIPKRWPLSARLVASSEERKVWRWLAGAFYDHSVMIKMPVTRFTLPRTKEQGVHWYEILSSVYCTFTVVGVDGRVVGCVDVPNVRRIARRNQILKETLLNQCGIAYLVIESVRLPSLQDIRSEFLGEMASMTREHERDEAAIRAASTSLRASLMHQRLTRTSDMAPLTAGSPKTQRSRDSGGHSVMPSQFPSSWSENSFIMPLDSRKAELQ
jgi:Protein of unknown function (DUF2726)